MSKTRPMHDLFAYFEEYEKRWFEESNESTFEKELLLELSGKHEFLGKITVKANSVEPIRLNTSQSVFRCSVCLNQGSSVLLDDLRRFSKLGVFEKDRYCIVLESLWKKYSISHSTKLDENGMVALLTDLIKLEKSKGNANSLGQQFHKARALFETAIRSRCDHEKEVAKKNQRSFGKADIDKQFDEQMGKILASSAMAGKIFDANKYEIGKVANATYEYLLANVQTIAKELLYNVRQLAENKYGLDSRGLPSGTVTEAEFLFAFMECVDLVINAYRPMVEPGCLHSSTFDYWLNGVGTKKSFPVLKCFLDPKDQDPGDLKAAGIQ